jgi:hypothetical protein
MEEAMKDLREEFAKRGRDVNFEYHPNLGGVTITFPPIPGQPAPVFMVQPMQQMPPGFAPGYAAGPMM